MVDIIIPVKDGSRNNNYELRYALRGIEKYLRNYRDIYIVGQKISWLKGVKFLNIKDALQGRFKERNIYRKILSASLNKSVSDNFLFMNDDHFLTREIDAPTIPFYYKSELRQTMERNSGNYRKTINHTNKLLLKRGLTTLDYDTHVPVLYNKDKIMCTFEGVDWNVPYGYGIKSLYCNINNVDGIQEPDCKLNNKTYEEINNRIKERFCFSTGSLNNDIMRVLNELYPIKSIYED